MIQGYSLSASVVFIVLVALVVILTIFITSNCDKAKDCTDVYCNRIKEHDYKFCIVILFFVIVFICTLSMGSNDEISKLLSFAGTLSSIILSVLAIFLTLMADKKSEYERLKTDNLVTRMETYTNETKASLAKAESIVEKLENLERKVDDVLKKEEKLIKIQNEIKDNINEYNQKTNKVDDIKAQYNDESYDNGQLDKNHNDNVDEEEGGEKGDWVGD